VRYVEVIDGIGGGIYEPMPAVYAFVVRGIGAEVGRGCNVYWNGPVDDFIFILRAFISRVFTFKLCFPDLIVLLFGV